MSAITGLVHLDGRVVNADDLEKMQRTLVHRGPDRSDVWLSGRVGLGHRLLATTPEAHRELLPVEWPAAGLCITADARLDNRQELLSQLAGARQLPEPLTDGQLILAAYEKWGHECPNHLLGDFSFAIWDARRAELFCARDPIGIRPFFYHHAPGRTFAFGSEIKAILALSETPRRINTSKLLQHLSPDRLTEVWETFYQEIHRLPAGHSLLVKAEGIKVSRHWFPNPHAELHMRTDREYEELFLHAFTRAVGRRMQSCGPVGTTLSGGLDSSAVACVAAKIHQELHGGSELHGGLMPAYSAIFPSLAQAHPECDERAFINEITNYAKIRPYVVNADEVSPLIGLEKIQYHLDGPMPGANDYMYWALWKVAKAHGTRVVLTGNDGDTVVSHGLEYLPHLARTGRWLALIGEARALAVNARPPHTDPRRIIWDFSVKPAIPQVMVGAYHQLRGRSPQHAGDGDIGMIHPEFARELMRERRFGSIAELCDQRMTGREQQMLYLTANTTQEGMEGIESLGMAYSLELRHPFYDRELLELCLSLPYSQKLKGGWTRSILRRSLEGIMPPKVQWRVGKGNLGAQAKRGMLIHERQRMEHAVCSSESRLGPYVNLPRLRQTYERYVAQTQFDERDVWELMVAVSLNTWLEQTHS
jgi:asparagine synthase (glutamine-hydrolysing)